MSLISRKKSRILGPIGFYSVNEVNFYRMKLNLKLY